MKVGIFTARSLTPLHPRLVLFKHYLEARQWEVTFINHSNHKGSVRSRINWLTLWFFDLLAVQKSKASLQYFDIVIINDLRYLPLAKHAFQLGKVVLYDTIDFNVHLRFYQLEKRFPLIHHLKNPIISQLTRIEKQLSQKYTHAITVNSKALLHHFGVKATALYYASSFEKTSRVNNEELPEAFLYLGAFSQEKGADEILSISHTLNIPLYIFGTVDSAEVKDKIATMMNVHFFPMMSVDALQARIEELFQHYFLMGFSMIQPAHYSYEVQEANKDIDYLSLGIPLIGNYRLPTKEKIERGCGLYYDDDKLKEKISNMELRKGWVSACKGMYQQEYANHLFNEKLDKVFASCGITLSS